ncbi:MAG TPA: GNAT family N-acetyltransferase [Anaerolineae bacterium]
MSIELVRHLEELAANAWPAEVVQPLDGWRLRFTHGVSRRANSVWPNQNDNNYPLSEKVALVEDFYRRAHLPARYQICPAAHPADLDAILAKRGYTVDATTHVQTAELATVLHAIHRKPTTAIRLSSAPTPSWLDAQRQLAELNERKAAVRQGILQRIGHDTKAIPIFVLAELNGEAAGIGLGVYEGGWLGIFNMVTHLRYRRQGVATAVLFGLAQWGQERGAERLYLQVMDNNTPAKRLYQELGFATLYHYHYREYSRFEE